MGRKPLSDKKMEVYLQSVMGCHLSENLI